MDITPVSVRFLGSGDAFGSGGRFQACIHVRSPDSNVLLDCGASSLIAMRRFGVEPNDIDAILVSHLHGDHFGGIPFFILDGQFLSKREQPLLIAGPPGIEARVRQAQEALFAGSSQTEQKYEIHFLEWHDRQQADIGGISVTPFEVVHASGAPPFALRVEIDRKTMAYSGDTEWTAALVEAAEGTDLFICETNFYDKKIKFHLDYETLMVHRRELNCRRLILTHMNSEMLARLPSLDVEAAEDGTEIAL
jgi:ribonuclease BN (tRNA processing enzyme)